MFIEYEDINDFFNEISNDLDIPDSYYEKADKSYKSLGSFLLRDDSLIKEYAPDVFLQGSFKLGTMIKPISENIHYDIDLVCKLSNINKNEITQEDLKKKIGKEVKQYVKTKNMINEAIDGKRCWTLNYHDEAQFHMDILPCLNNRRTFEELLEKYSMNTDYKEEAIAITDKNSIYYKVISDEWETSNPKGYYRWFMKKMNFEDKKRKFAEQLMESVENIPDYKVKTPLQKAAQVLKRHRDYSFKGKKDKPSSVVITTLLGLTYNGSENILDIISNMIENIHLFLIEKDGRYYLTNPVNPLENFTDKWNTNKKRAFFRWINTVSEDLLFYNKKINYYGDNVIDKMKEIYNIKKSKYIKGSSELIKKEKHIKRTKWNMLNKTEVDIIAYKKESKDIISKRFKSGEIVKKSSDLKFKANAKNIKDYEMFWRVTNTGYDAEIENNLRGDFYESEIIEGDKVREEKAKYFGSHFIECFLIKDNDCYGKSDVFVVNIL
ncbi:nucleotidyltransferase [Haliovirga abyssi]|uniref:Adenylyl/Guanylyl and SMODS C-terminal sensor domain-containing protein n=1 Tax=Haliovirga abyssi TaxID=2996794 RepID=A0AAU9D0I9_9FUSO|nr:nucleotidyltransferase [Haliovirga abyssi]BDU49474.1 hypothetical protein HLVA_00430 [Haliovirga abyssi]